MFITDVTANKCVKAPFNRQIVLLEIHDSVFIVEQLFQNGVYRPGWGSSVCGATSTRDVGRAVAPGEARGAVAPPSPLFQQKKKLKKKISPTPRAERIPGRVIFRSYHPLNEFLAR